MTTATTLPTPTQSPIDQAQQVLRSADQPLTANEVKKRLPGVKFKKNELEQALEEMCTRGELYRGSPSGKSARYWTRDERQEIDTAIEKFLAAGPRKITEIVDAVKGSLKGVKDKAIKDEVTRLREQKRLHDNPRKTIGLQPIDPLASVALSQGAIKGLRSAFAKAEKAGATLDQFLQRVRELMVTAPKEVVTPPVTPPVTAAEQVPTPASEPVGEGTMEPPPIPSEDSELQELVLKAVREAGPGVPVSVADLRRQMPAEYRDKARFDEAVWGLVDQNKLYVIKHNYPASLSDEERAELLKDTQGEVYAYVAQHS